MAANDNEQQKSGDKETRMAAAIELAHRGRQADWGRFQRDHGTAFLEAYDRQDADGNAPSPLHTPRLEGDEINRLDDYGHGRGFLKVNEDPPHNHYESHDREHIADFRPIERLAFDPLEQARRVQITLMREKAQQAKLEQELDNEFER
jgi:hypothetical protein